jgi:transcriptional regulator with XRE-family HTH domain
METTVRTVSTIGARLRYLRFRRNWTKVKLAQVSGVPLNTISLVERGLRSGEGLTVATARKLATAFGMTVEALISEERQEGEPHE